MFGRLLSRLVYFFELEDCCCAWSALFSSICWSVARGSCGNEGDMVALAIPKIDLGKEMGVDFLVALALSASSTLAFTWRRAPRSSKECAETACVCYGGRTECTGLL